MHFYLHSKDQDRKSTGKTSSGRTVTYELLLLDERRTLSIIGETRERCGDGSRGGTPRTIKRSISITLDQQDLERIFEAAFSHGLFTPARLVKATEALRTALSHMEPPSDANKVA